MWGYDDYPCRLYQDNGFCPWTPDSPARQCTSFARWRARYDLRVLIPDWGNGGQFGSFARAAGYAVDGNARLYDLVCFPAGVQGSDPRAGHVAALFKIDNGVLWLEEYNFRYPFDYDQRPLDHTAGLEFIHLIRTAPTPAPVPVPSPTEDDMVILATTERVAGQGPDPRGTGAIYLVSNWPYGPKKWISSPAQLAQYIPIAGKVQVVNPDVLDRCEEEPMIASTYVTRAPSTFLERPAPTPDPEP